MSKKTPIITTAFAMHLIVMSLLSLLGGITNKPPTFSSQDKAQEQETDLSKDPLLTPKQNETKEDLDTVEELQDEVSDQSVDPSSNTINGGDKSDYNESKSSEDEESVADSGSDSTETPLQTYRIIIKFNEDATYELLDKEVNNLKLSELFPLFISKETQSLNKYLNVDTVSVFEPLFEDRFIKAVDIYKDNQKLELSEIESVITSDIQDKYPERKKRTPKSEVPPSLLSTFIVEAKILDLDTFMKKLQQDKNIEYVEIDGEVKAATIPNDTHFSLQWGLHNTGIWGGVVDTDIDAPEAWDTTEGRGSITIAYIDTGIDLSNAEFSGRILGGRDFVNGDWDPSDDNGHGTYMAGIGSARGNNSIGVAGVCWECRILPVKVLGSEGEGFASDMADGIIWASDNGADVMNISITHSYVATVENAINHAYDQGVVLIASRGQVNYNDPASPRDPTEVRYPAGHANVIAVGAHNYCNERKERYNCEQDDSWESRYGNDLDFLAPGVYIYTITIGGAPVYITGTSGSTAFASGVAGLILSIDSNLSPDGVRLIMRTSTDDMNTPGFDIETGFGRINANNAIESACSSDPGVCARFEYDGRNITEIEGNENSIIEPGESIRIEIFLRNLGYQVDGVSGSLLTSSSSIENISAPYGEYFSPYYIPSGGRASIKYDFDVAEEADFGDVDLTLDISIGSTFVVSFHITEIIENEIIHIVREDRSDELGKPIRHIKYYSHEEITWMNACMGVIPKGKLCAQVLVPGYIIILRDNQTGWRYEYHTDLTEKFVYARAIAPSSVTSTSNVATFSANILVRFATFIKRKL